MPPKNQKFGQLSIITAVQTNAANTAASDDTTLGGFTSNINAVPTNSEMLSAIQLFKDDFVKKFTDMLEAVKGIKGELIRHSQRIGKPKRESPRLRKLLLLFREKLNNLSALCRY